MDLKLPHTVATKQQLIALIHDIEGSIDMLTEAEIRARETQANVDLPPVNKSVSSLLEANGIEFNLANLQSVQEILRELKDKAPAVRFVFASEPNATELEKLAAWFRDNSRLPVLINVGIQPQIAVGCILETPSHRYDFSLRRKLSESNALLEALRNG